MSLTVLRRLSTTKTSFQREFTVPKLREEFYIHVHVQHLFCTCNSQDPPETIQPCTCRLREVERSNSLPRPGRVQVSWHNAKLQRNSEHTVNSLQRPYFTIPQMTPCSQTYRTYLMHGLKQGIQTLVVLRFDHVAMLFSLLHAPKTSRLPHSDFVFQSRNFKHGKSTSEITKASCGCEKTR